VRVPLNVSPGEVAVAVKVVEREHCVERRRDVDSDSERESDGWGFFV